MSITWILGKGDNADSIWSAFDYEYTLTPEIIANINLFEKKNYKYIYNKKDKKFFMQKRSLQNNEIVIKGLNKLDTTIMDQTQDKIIDLNILTTQQQLVLFAKTQGIKFSQEELTFVKKANSLDELSTIITLKKVKLPIELWSFFIKKDVENQNWSLKLKNRSLFPFAILNPQHSIPAIMYSINAKTYKAPLLFLRAKIQQGESVWSLNKLWESLI